MDNDNRQRNCMNPPRITQCVYIPVVFLGAMAVSPFTVILDQYIYHRIGVSKGLINETGVVNHSKCSKNETLLETEVEKLSSYFIMYSKMACDLPAFVTMPIWAAYGDVYARRNPVIIASVGMIASLLLLVFVELFHLPLWVTLISSGLQGLSGYLGLAVCIACAAHIAHYSPPTQRTMEMAILELTYYIGGTAGDLGCGFILDMVGYMWCFIIIGAIATMLLMYCIAILKSGPDVGKHVQAVLPSHHTSHVSIQAEHEEEEDDYADAVDSSQPLIRNEIQKSSRSMGSIILQPIKLYFEPKSGVLSTIKCQLWLILCIVYLHDSAHGGSYSIIDIFALSSPLCWNPVLLGYYRGGDMFVVGIGAVVTSAILKSRVRPECLLFLGQISGAFRGVLLGLASTNVFMYASMFAGSLRVLCIATCRSMASTLVLPEQHGAAIGGIASIQILCDVFSGTLLSFIYAKTVNWYQGTAFFVTALFYVIGMPLTGWYALLSKRQRPRISMIPEEREHEDE